MGVVSVLIFMGKVGNSRSWEGLFSNEDVMVHMDGFYCLLWMQIGSYILQNFRLQWTV